MLEVEQAAMNVEARARLSEIKSKLGIESSTPEAAGEVTRRTTAPATAPPPHPPRDTPP